MEKILLKICFNKHNFARTFITFGFRCKIISVKLLVFGDNIPTLKF